MQTLRPESRKRSLGQTLWKELPVPLDSHSWYRALADDVACEYQARAQAGGVRLRLCLRADHPILRFQLLYIYTLFFMPEHFPTCSLPHPASPSPPGKPYSTFQRPGKSMVHLGVSAADANTQRHPDVCTKMFTAALFMVHKTGNDLSVHLEQGLANF